MVKKTIKRSVYFKCLSKDHHFGLLFCWKIRQGLKKEVTIIRMFRYVQYFWLQHLLPHFREEELILFSTLNDRRVQKAIKEHRQIGLQVKILHTCSNNEIRKKLAKLADMMDEHIRYEERELFPFLEKKLSKEQLENIGKQIQGHERPSLQDQYKDEFWNI